MRYRRLMTALAILLVPTFALAQSEQFTQDLSLGSQGGDVPLLQQTLSQIPAIYPGGTVTGVYDAATQDAVTRFQLKVGIADPTILGTVETTTRTFLNAAVEDRTNAEFNADVLARNAAGARDLDTALQVRHAEMQKLLVVNPLKALEVRLTKQQRGQFPLDSRPLIEADVRIHGQLVQTITEHPELNFAPTAFALYAAHGVVYRSFSSDPRLLPLSRKAWIRSGVGLDSLFVPSQDPKAIKLLPPKLNAATSTSLAIAVLLLSFPDLPPPTLSPAAITQALNTLVNYYNEVSYGTFAVTFQISGWHKSGPAYADYKCDYERMKTEAIALSDAEVNFGNFTSLMVILGNGGTCPVPGFADSGPRSFTTNDGPKLLASSLLNEWTLPNGAIHEFGHNLGMQHAHLLDCSANGMVLDHDPLHRCQWSDYGDDWDVMGGTGNGHLSASHKEGLGFIGQAGSPQAILRVTTPGVYSIDVYETPGGTKALSLPRAAGGAAGTLWTEYHHAIGFDTTPFWFYLDENNPPLVYPSNFQDGAIIHISFSPGALGLVSEPSFLVHNGAPPLDLINETPEDFHAYFGVGEPFYDPDSQWSITPVTLGATKLYVRVDQIPRDQMHCNMAPPFDYAGASESLYVQGDPVKFMVLGGVGPFTWSAPNGTPPTGNGSASFVTKFQGLGTFPITVTNGAGSLVSTCTLTVLGPPLQV